MLEDTLYNNQTPSLILGDFNGWHPAWGSPKTNSRGKTIQQFIDNTQLILLNDKSPTHFSTHNTYTHIDLLLCSATLAPHAKWEILNDLHGSDHFPIVISLFPPNKINKFSKPFFILKKPTGSNTRLSHTNITKYFPLNVNKEAAQINKIILHSANISIPQTSVNTKPYRVP